MAETLKLDLGCGRTPAPGFEGVDLYTEEAKHKIDLTQFPWIWEDNSVDEIICTHFFEHIPGELRGKFMEEVWRVLKPGARATFVTPYWSSRRAVQDFTHAWPPIVEDSYLYFDRNWRRKNNLDHPPYPTKCHFEFGHGVDYNSRLLSRAQEYRDMAVMSQLNAADNLTVTMIKKPL